jgi:hypothetical protein
MGPLAFILSLVFSFAAGVMTPLLTAEKKPETVPYDRCVQLLGKYVTPTVNPVAVEMLIDSCLKKRK